MLRRIAVVLASTILLAGSVSAKSRAADALGRLQSDLDKIFSSRDFSGSQWRISVFSLSRGEKLYEREAAELCIPASANKLITAAVALSRLGPDYQFKTSVFSDGRIEGGVLHGNLIIVGSGDPAQSPRFHGGDPFGAFQGWAQKLKGKGVAAIYGDIVGDGGAFEEIPYGDGWEWNDLTQGYAAPVSALQFNENLVSFRIFPGSVQGSGAFVETSPLKDYLNLDAGVLTGRGNSASRIRIQRNDAKESVALRGSVPLKSAAIVRDIPVRSPVRYYVAALSQALREQGIDLSRAGIREARNCDLQSASLLWTHVSPALSEIIKPLLKESLNLFAETLARSLGVQLRGEGSFAEGKTIVEQTLAELDVDKGSYRYADASGLSRLNLVSADMLVRILRSMHKKKFFPAFYEALPTAGIDGTLQNRMKKTAAENNARAKTGTLSGISAVSGYVQTRDGEMLAFAMIANNFLLAKSRAETAQDAAIVKLANFSRK